MASSITTTGTLSDPISTTHRNGESVADWVERHNAAVGGATPSGNKLTTSWKCAAGTKAETTTRNPGESDVAFRTRHIADYVTRMTQDEPLP